jgi:hypothetical protein
MVFIDFLLSFLADDITVLLCQLIAYLARYGAGRVPRLRNPLHVNTVAIFA